MGIVQNSGRFMGRFSGYLLVASHLIFIGSGFAQLLPDPPGTYLPKSEDEIANLDTYGPGDRLTAVYYFYWYRYSDACVGDVCNPLYHRSHIEFASGSIGKPGPISALTNTPTDLNEMDFTSPDWHRAQIEQIVSASIDVILPVFWGVPGRYNQSGHYPALWSKVGLEAFNEAMMILKEEGKKVPKVGMMYDTTTLSFESPFNPGPQPTRIDLKTSSGKNHFYATIRDFYSLVPPENWAQWDGHPLVWLYGSDQSGGFDETTLPETKNRFSEDFFGKTPWFVAHLDWLGAGADWEYRWGGAIQPSFLSVNSIGPGFDRSGSAGEPKGSKVERERDEGKFYRSSWEHALRSEAAVTVVETWNELHEGSEICPTIEDGKVYLSITRDYASVLKTDSNPKPIPGPFLGKSGASWPGPLQTVGLSPVKPEDGEFKLHETEDGILAELGTPYLYFDVDDSFGFTTRDTIEAEIMYYDLPDRFGRIFIEYDSWDRDANYHGIYKTSEEIPLTGSFQWKTATVPLPSARFGNNQNGGADLRIVGPRGIRIRGIQLLKSSKEPTDTE